MIEFLGTSLVANIPLDTAQIDLASLCGVSEARAKELVGALTAAKEHSLIEAEQVLAPDLPPVMGNHFSLGLLVQHAQLNADTPTEILFIGLLVGRVYTEMEARAAESNKRVTKMIALMQENPAKALRKMQKEIKKSLLSSKKQVSQVLTAPAPTTGHELVVLLNDSGLDAGKTRILSSRFADYFTIAEQWKAEAQQLIVTGEDQTERMLRARQVLVLCKV